MKKKNTAGWFVVLVLELYVGYLKKEECCEDVVVSKLSVLLRIQLQTVRFFSFL